jgi:hypothetical protein
MRGFRYFNWSGFGISIAASLLLGAASWVALRSLARLRSRRVLTGDIAHASWAAALVSALPVLFKEVDALQVMLWYGLALWLSMVLAGFGARALARLWR